MITKYSFKLIKTILMSIKISFTDFDFLYYSIFMFVLLFSILVHPFFFGLLTFDFLRTKFLKNVVKAVWIPRWQLAFTFLVFLLIEYFFTVFAYIVYFEHFEEGTCD